MFESSKRMSISKRILFVIIALFLAAGTLPGCAGGNADATGNSSIDVNQMYQQSLEDAKTVNHDKISTNLTAIDKYSSVLEWEGEPGNSRVLVDTWTSRTFYDNSVGQEYYMPKNAWVFVHNEMKNYLDSRGYTSRTITPLRIEQLLGMPPNTGKTKFVEMYADPQILFRPSPDPEVTDHEAELDFPPDHYRAFSTTMFVKDDDDDKYYTYPDWFNNLVNKSYSGENAHPWTRLGYTYDWAPESSDHKGISEFIVASGSTVRIKTIIPNDSYFD